MYHEQEICDFGVLLVGKGQIKFYDWFKMGKIESCGLKQNKKEKTIPPAWGYGQ